MNTYQKLYLSTAIVFVLAIPLFMFGFGNSVTEISKDFTYSANIISVDNFYDTDTEKFVGEIHSKTKYSYYGIDKQDDSVLIKGVFDVREPDDTPIFNVERTYAIHPKEYAHVPEYGDAQRRGYFFLPRSIREGEPFMYWFIAIDIPVLLQFADAETINGLEVYHYRTQVDKIDLSEGYAHLPGVPEEIRVKNDIRLEAWFEPTTGRLVKFSESADSNFFDAQTGSFLYPRNKYQNTYTTDSVVKQTTIIKDIIKNRNVYKITLPVLLAIISLLLVFISFSSLSTSIVTLIAYFFTINAVLFLLIDVWFSPRIMLKVILMFTTSLLSGIVVGRIVALPLIKLKENVNAVCQGDLSNEMEEYEIKEVKEILESNLKLLIAAKLAIFRKKGLKTNKRIK